MEILIGIIILCRAIFRFSSFFYFQDNISYLAAKKREIRRIERKDSRKIFSSLRSLHTEYVDDDESNTSRFEFEMFIIHFYLEE